MRPLPAHPPSPLPRSKSIEKRGPGLGYGFVVAMCFTLAFFVLLCGLVLDGFRDVVTAELEVKREYAAAACLTLGAAATNTNALTRLILHPTRSSCAVAGSWSKYNTGQYVGTIAFSYICFIMFLAFFFAVSRGSTTLRK